MDIFLDTNNLLKLNQEDIKHINRSTTNNEIKAVINLLTRKAQDQENSQLNLQDWLNTTNTPLIIL